VWIASALPWGQRLRSFCGWHPTFSDRTEVVFNACECMGFPVSVCPVPVDQRPINEYQDLKQSCFFGWSSDRPRPYLTRIITIWASSWLIVGPVAAASFDPLESPGRFSLVGVAGANFVLGLILLRLYLGWAYVCDRLLSQSVVYEETGWYDGQSWTKPAEEWAKDRLIGSYQVQPILRRLGYTLGFLFSLTLLGGGVWHLLSPN
jgi:hypothetical protein